MPSKFSEAPEVAEVAAELIERFHPHIAGTRIEYAFRSGKWEKKGAQQIGEARIISSLAAFLAGEPEDEEQENAEEGRFFAVVISSVAWNCADGDTKRYFVDHELEHLKLDDVYDQDGKLTGHKPRLKGHDIEEHSACIERHGLVLPDRRAFAELCAAAMARQPGLDFEGDDTQVTLSVTTAEGERGAPVHTTGRGMRQAAEMSPGQMRAALKRAEERVA